MSTLVRASAKAASAFAPTVYPVEDEVGEDRLQGWIVELLRPLLERGLSHRAVHALVGADQFIYYRQHTPTLRVSPDIYVLSGVAPRTRVTSWKTWQKNIVPSFALEVVSKDWEKDYVEAPARYADMGVAELLIFDPTPECHADGIRWQAFRRVAGRPLARVEATDGDRVRSKALGCFLRVVGKGDDLRLRVGDGPGGDELFPTGEEAETAAKEAALERIAALEAELRRVRRPRRYLAPVDVGELGKADGARDGAAYDRHHGPQPPVPLHERGARLGRPLSLGRPWRHRADRTSTSGCLAQVRSLFPPCPRPRPDVHACPL